MKVAWWDGDILIEFIFFDDLFGAVGKFNNFDDLSLWD